MNSIFISYRRADTDAKAKAERIRDRLEVHFGKEEVFLDVESLHSGESFPETIAGTIRHCALMLVVIGPMWATMRGDDGQTRLFIPGDWVHREIKLALDHHVEIIPIPVDATPVPVDGQLPDDIKKLASLHARRVRGDPDFKHDIADLIEELERQPRLAKLHKHVVAAQSSLQPPAPQPVYTPPAVAPRPTYYPTPQATRSATRSLWIILGSLAGVIALCAGIGYFASQFNSNGVYTGAFGQGSGRPSQVTNQQLKQLKTAVDDAMQTCASAATAAPANCPQIAPIANGVIWTLHGDPWSGTTVQHTGSQSDGQFTVNGAYVFTVQYGSSDSQLDVIPGYYTATIPWNGATLGAVTLAHADTGPNVPRPPQATDAAALAAARDYFAGHAHCSTPPACQRMPPFLFQEEYGTTNIVYSIPGDQFATARVTYQNTGVIQITGNYAMHVTCHIPPADIGGPCDTPLSGNFEFLLTVDSGALQVIDITYTNSSG